MIASNSSSGRIELGDNARALHRSSGRGRSEEQQIGLLMRKTVKACTRLLLLFKVGDHVVDGRGRLDRRQLRDDYEWCARSRLHAHWVIGFRCCRVGEAGTRLGRGRGRVERRGRGHVGGRGHRRVGRHAQRG